MQIGAKTSTVGSASPSETRLGHHALIVGVASFGCSQQSYLGLGSESPRHVGRYHIQELAVVLHNVPTQQDIISCDYLLVKPCFGWEGLPIVSY